MTWLFEQPLPILVIGVIGGAILAGILAQTGNRLFLKLLLGWITLFALLLVVEYVVVTEREKVEAAVYEIAAALETNDAPRVQRSISEDAPELRREVESKLAYVQIESAKVKRNLEISFLPHLNPPVAVAKGNVVITGNLKNGLTTGRAFPTFVVLTFKQDSDETWRLIDYQLYDPRGEQAGEIRPPV